VLTIRGDAGMILGDAPVFERYFAGGTGSMRGFAFRGIGERDGIDETNIGGDFLILLGSEYSYPLYGENLRGHVFLDTGTAGTGTYRSALGTGIRINLNFLGPLPIELNVAMPLTEGDDDDTQVFSFIVGGVFAGR
jgi:outer membrane protein insertion porin family